MPNAETQTKPKKNANRLADLFLKKVPAGTKTTLAELQANYKQFEKTTKDRHKAAHKGA